MRMGSGDQCRRESPVTDSVEGEGGSSGWQGPEVIPQQASLIPSEP